MEDLFFPIFFDLGGHMLDSNYYGEFLKSQIPTARYASGGKEILCRCFYCPDSADMSSAHFYIQIPQNKNQVSKFYCHKCHSSGYVTHKTLIQWGIYDDNVAMYLTEHNKVTLSNRNNIRLINRSIYNINNDYINPDDLSASKLRYINNRLGLNLSYQDLSLLPY